MANRHRVLVCGTNYGYRYLQVLDREAQRYQLAGILSRGSVRSTLLATLHDVPLYRGVRDVPGDVDLAIAAMGPGGNRAVIELLRRGIDVLCEHPLSVRFLENAFRTAAASGAAFHVNAHFPALPAPRALIEHCRRRSESARPLSIDARLHPELLYAFVDILRHALGSLRPYRGSIAGVPTAVQYDRDNVVDWHVVIAFPSGHLTMPSMAGPVIWNGSSRLTDAFLSDTLYANDGLTKPGFIEQRLAAIASSIQALADRSSPPEQSSEHLFDVSRSMETLAKRLRAGRAKSPP